VTAPVVRLAPPVRQVRDAAAVWVIDGLGDAPAPGELLCLVSPLSAAAGEPRAAARECGREVIELALPGIGSRYLGGVARQAARCGWGVGELAALVTEIESRCTYWIAASTLDRIGAPTRRRISAGRAPALRWSHRGWTTAESGASTLDVVARGAATGRALCLCAASGSHPPRALSRRLDELARSGAVVGRMRAGLAAMLGATWAVEALGAPHLTASQLTTLREQFVTAPRCGWCGLPVVGNHCRRCTPGGA
jgi:hypothetical protein